jgi:hypothetical protein
LEAKTAGKILIGDGVDLLSLGHQGGNIDDGPVTKTQPKSHVAIGIEARDSAPSTGVLLTLQDFAIKVAKLAINIVASNPKPGVIVYGGDGVASVLDSTGADSKVLTPNNTATPSFKVVNKKIDLLGDGGRTTLGVTGEVAGTDILLVKAHDLGSFPTNVSFYLECTIDDKSYVAGDRVIYGGHQADSAVAYSWDATNVYAAFNYVPKIPDKVTAAQDATNAFTEIDHEKWKVVALVSA